jgi:hypothetical protein
MKRRAFIRHLESNGCRLLREGGKHSDNVYEATRKTSTMPRHRELNELRSRKICRDLGINEP